ncbi:GNAT family N-acetyltransferase [Streptomyces sp. NBC_00203]|uniref:GNAT family N-acetyltransferase n=1 Tax=Streptomyces sp. NBC_00203 TaxID=2975680 RepID=UPI003255F29A
MPLQLETARLTLRPWTESDVDAHRALVAERGDGMPSIEHNRRMIEDQRAASALTGIALLAVIRRGMGHFIGYCGLTVGRVAAFT